VLGVGAGYLGSHYDKEIARVWSWGMSGFQGTTPEELFGPSIFALVVLIFCLLFAFMGWAQQKGSGRFNQAMTDSADLLKQNTDDLKCGAERMTSVNEAIEKKTVELRDRAILIENRIQHLYTLPPQGFLEKYAKAVYGIVDSLLATRINARLPKDNGLQAIRLQLSYVMQLAISFDSDAKDAMYGCNVLVFRDSANLSDAERETLQSRLRFIERGVDVRQLHGVLEAVADYSVSSADLVAPDAKLPSLCLPIPKLKKEEKDEDTIPGLLPGAPDAFIRKKITIIEDPSDWKRKMETNAFSAFVKKDMLDFAKNEMQFISSFISIPLYPPPEIVNIHRNAPNLLLAEKLELFSPLISLSVKAIENEMWRYVDQSSAMIHSATVEGA
jgi:hypothetical protein